MTSEARHGSPGGSPSHPSSALVALAWALFLSGCFMLGPDHVRPAAPTAEEWIDARAPGVRAEAGDYAEWWAAFADPVLNSLVETAYRQNRSLQIAGIRVLEAQARRGIAIGNLFPQLQEGFGGYGRTEMSENAVIVPPTRTFGEWQAGFDAAWELDVWGRFRRGVEAADADLLASVASYDDVLVSLVAEVATTYLLTRTLEERLEVVRANAAIQERSLQISEAKFRNGMVTELDVAQARSLLEDTQAFVPALEATIRRTQNNLCLLLGIPPRDLGEMLAGPGRIPATPREVAAGVPAELLRRRPDIRQAERAVAAQSARIGIALSDLYPQFSLVGTISLKADDFGDLFEGDSFEGFGGPNFRWAILNYGRIRNNVRVQDAVFQQLVVAYEDTVLRAQQEMENALAGYLGRQREVEFLSRSVEAARRAVDLANIQYREGEVEYSRVLDTQQFLLGTQDRYVNTKGSVALSLIAAYKALGGGWELRKGNDFVPEDVKEQMRSRTNWGGMLTPDARTEVVRSAEPGAEDARRWWHLPWR